MCERTYLSKVSRCHINSLNTFDTFESIFLCEIMKNKKKKRERKNLNVFNFGDVAEI